MVDENRIKEYKENNPDEFGGVSVLDGVQITSTADINKGFVEFQKGSHTPENTVYLRFMTQSSGSNHWNYDEVEPRVRNHKLIFELNINYDNRFPCKKQVH